MTQELTVLTLTAASIGFIHTILGPDHYLPFIVMAKAQKWSMAKTSFITILCGIGHVLSSVILGLIGIALGIAVHKLEAFESVRGSIAGWALIIFGFVYLIWGIKRAIKNKPHTHAHFHSDGTFHNHIHKHTAEHSHVHAEEGKVNLTPWILFTIFVFGPCEPLIPILMYPAAKSSIFGMVIVATVFSIVTILTMLSVVIIASLGVNLLPFGKLERYTHALAGATILLAGLGIQVLGL